MTKVEILRNLKHSGQAFQAGEIRILDDHTAGYFCGNGWAKFDSCDSLPADTAPKTLKVQNGQHGHQSKVGV